MKGVLQAAAERGELTDQLVAISPMGMFVLGTHKQIKLAAKGGLILIFLGWKLTTVPDWKAVASLTDNKNQTPNISYL